MDPSTSPSFLGTWGSARYTETSVVVLPCPYDGTSTWAKGADQGPHALLEASDQLEDYDVELGLAPFPDGVATLDPLDLQGLDPETATQRIASASEAAARDGKFVLGLGGEHTVTVGLTRGIRRALGPFHVLQIDAHADLRETYEGTPYNHACVMRRVAEDDPEARLAAVGVRAMCEEEAAFATRRGVQLVTGHDVHRDAAWIDRVLEHLASPLYITLDLDGLDPSIMPSTGTPVPGGLGWYDLLTLLRRVGERFDVIGADVNELKPDSINHHAPFLAAQAAFKLLAYASR